MEHLIKLNIEKPKNERKDRQTETERERRRGAERKIRDQERTEIEMSTAMLCALSE